MQNNEFNEFDELIREIVQQEIQNYMKNEMIFRGITGQVVKVNDDDTYSVDIVTTVLNNVENKSGSSLAIGDSVTLSERIGSDYSNCFINVKNGHQKSELKETAKEIKDQEILMEISEVTDAGYSTILYGGKYIVFNNSDIVIKESIYPNYFDDTYGINWNVNTSGTSGTDIEMEKKIGSLVMFQFQRKDKGDYTKMKPLYKIN